MALQIALYRKNEYGTQVSFDCNHPGLARQQAGRWVKQRPTHFATVILKFDDGSKFCETFSCPIDRVLHRTRKIA